MEDPKSGIKSVLKALIHPSLTSKRKNTRLYSNSIGSKVG